MIKEDFLLKNETAKRLFAVADAMPIVDYHCHISPKEIAQDHRFATITELWLGGDHYKWRLLRSNGVPEREITGDADDYTKFLRFAEMLPKAVGNPMYHWCHLELKRYFGYDGVLNGDTAREVYDLCNRRLNDADMTARGLIERSNVRMIGTTDDPVDSLEWHRKIAADKTFRPLVCPTFRPDRAADIEKAGFAAYIGELAKAAEMPIQSAEDVKAALARRLDFFCQNGCRATDHGLDQMVYAPASPETVESIFRKAMRGEPLSGEEIAQYKTAMLLFLGERIAEKGLVMQLHFTVQRNTNSRMLALLGANAGFDCMSANMNAEALTGFLNALDVTGHLPKTVLYSLNPNDNELIDSVIGSFQGEGIPCKIQHGAAWWFNDTKSGMEVQMRSLANLSLLGNFIGMLTDSRSFLSYTRHEYFRRILCNVIGEWVENGEYPDDEKTLTDLIKAICYQNAASYFGI